MASSWHSLSGYLSYSPGGVLGKILPKSRNWYVLDERNCRLLSFKSRDAAKQKQPDGHIDLMKAAITLSNASSENQFIILCEGKEHVFTADNHECCSVWLHALQSKRNVFAKQNVYVRKCSPDRQLPHTEHSSPDLRGSRSAPEVECRKYKSLESASMRSRKQLERQHKIMRFFTQSSPTAIDNPTDVLSPSLDDDVFADGPLMHSLLQQTQSSASEKSGRLTSNDSTLDRDSDYSSHMSSQVADLEQQIISAKCDLAVMMNRETSFMALLSQRDDFIDELTVKLKEFEKIHSSRKSEEKYIKESVKKLRNENEFLNTEIRSLADLQHQHRLHTNELESRMEQLKRDYVYTLQSCVTIPTGDVMDGMSVKLYGGDVHRERVTSLLEEAREMNPSLPTCEGLLQKCTHIDAFGFTHEHRSEGMALHYAARTLVSHYDHSLAEYEQHQRAWKTLLHGLGDQQSLQTSKELKRLCRRGIPAQYRSDVWRRLVYAQVQDIMEDKGPHYYNHLVNSLHDSQLVGTYRKQISLDLLRTMPNNINFNCTEAEGTQKLREILEAFCLHNPTVGYCQGMNFVTATSLLLLQPEDAFWTLIAVTEKYFGANYFDENLTGAQADQEVLKDIVMEKLPELYHHLQNLDIEISTVTLNWFMALFFDAVPFETLLRIWDCFLLEGPKVLFRLSVAVLKMNEPGILLKKDTIGIMKHLKCCAKLAFDPDDLIKRAFEDMEPFPRRKDLSAKQVVYLNALKEKMRKRVVYKRSLTELDLGYLQGQSGTERPAFECAIPCTRGNIWVVNGTQKTCCIYELDCNLSLLRNINQNIESRVMCGLCIEDRVVIMGTLSWHLHAFSRKTGVDLWCLRLQESVMSLASYSHKHKQRVFCGLANGTIAILEVKKLAEPMGHPIYIPISYNAVTSLLQIGEDFLWAGCGPHIYVLHARTLDTLEKFSVSSNHFDHISSLRAANEDEVWLAIKGSPCIQLWNAQTFTCQLTFDVSSNARAAARKSSSSTAINKARVTALLPFHDSLWVANAEGYLYMYDIRDRLTLTPALTSQAQSARSVSGSTSPVLYKFEADLLMEKVNQLYYDRLFEDRKLNTDPATDERPQENGETELVEKGSKKNQKTKAPPKPQRKIKKQQAVDDSPVKTPVDVIRSINVETGSIEIQEYCKLPNAVNENNITDKTYAEAVSCKGKSCSSTTSSSDTVKHLTNGGCHDYATRRGTLQADLDSLDSMSITSTSSLEEQRAAIARVMQSRVQQQQLQRLITGCSLSSGSSIEDSRPFLKRRVSSASHDPEHNQQPVQPEHPVRLGFNEEFYKIASGDETVPCADTRNSVKNNHLKTEFQPVSVDDRKTSSKFLECSRLDADFESYQVHRGNRYSKRAVSVPNLLPAQSLYSKTSVENLPQFIPSPLSKDTRSTHASPNVFPTAIPAYKPTLEPYSHHNPKIQKATTYQNLAQTLSRFNEGAVTQSKQSPSFIRGVIDTGRPLPPMESSVNAGLFRSHTEPCIGSLSPVRECSSSDNNCDKCNDGSNRAYSTCLKQETVDIGNQRARFMFQKHLSKEDNTGTKQANLKTTELNGPQIEVHLSCNGTEGSEGQYLTTIEECTEASSCTSPVCNTSGLQHGRSPNLQRKLKAGCTYAHDDHRMQKEEAGNKRNGCYSLHAPPPVVVSHTPDMPGPPHNTPDKFNDKQTTEFVWSDDNLLNVDHVDLNSSSPAGDQTELSSRQRQLDGKTPVGRLRCEGQAGCSVELILQARIKISDQPVRCLAQTWLEHEAVIVSCAGCEHDQEAILKWTQLPNETLWTNEVVKKERIVEPEPELPVYKRLIRRISTYQSLKSLTK